MEKRTMNLKIAILESSNNDFENTKILLNKWADEQNINVNITRFTDEQILKNFSSDEYDILFADIDLNGTETGTGFSICRKLRELGFQKSLVFLTSNRNYTLKGYEVGAAGYIIKPLFHDNLSDVMRRAIDAQLGSFYYLNDRSHITQIAFTEIIYIEKSGHNIQIFTTGGQIYTERISLSTVLTRLPSQFIQCHKSTIVNVKNIVHIQGNTMHMKNGHTLLIGRSYLPAIRKHLS